MPEESTRSRGAPVQAPYFFLSYAHTPGAGGSTRPDMDQQVARLFDDLSCHIMHLTTLRDGIPAGYMDREMRPGNFWKPDLLRALATCQVFVPLYSPRYFESEWCGYEWEGFSRRQARQRELGRFTANAIVPVLWTEERRLTLPTIAEEIQYFHPDMGQRYRDEGLYGLITKELGSDYQRATLEIARTVIDVARMSRLEPCDMSLFDNLSSPFKEGA